MYSPDNLLFLFPDENNLNDDIFKNFLEKQMDFLSSLTIAFTLYCFITTTLLIANYTMHN